MSRHWLAALALIPSLAGCDRPEPAAPAAPSPAGTTAPAPAPAAAPALPAGWKTYSDPALGIAFDYAPDRHTDGCGDVGEGVVCIGLFGPGQGGEGEALIYFQPVDGSLDTVATEQAGFEKNAQGVLMTTYGRFEPVPVERFTARGGPGLKATVTCGTEDEETGFHAAGGECLWAVVSDGTRSVVATTQGRIGLDADTMTSLNSVRFIPKG
ncbi:hypothetical protein [Brevundimonas goettingensis]|uniref:Uncharacterized protein n=1 Tax=Brevundimonas goettingensis TaxID=2774190 RepID=A0A975C1E5_9CAUL|nr:hypothetical protein [Brevundimonas goettingensis]QTC91127.1 hypothetical protein IFJ75_18285 [Brevundimonas goettingensis]